MAYESFSAVRRALSNKAEKCRQAKAAEAVWSEATEIIVFSKGEADLRAEPAATSAEKCLQS